MANLIQFFMTELPTVIALCAVAVFALVERAIPRMRARPAWREHLPPILALAALTTITTMLLNHGAQGHLIGAFSAIKLMSLAKLDLPAPLLFAACFLLVDFLTYVFHWLSHAVQPLWRLHSVHHSDEHVTAVSGQLHHPLETVAAYVFLLFVYVILGVPVVVAAIYSLVFAVHNAFTHSNIRMPRAVDGALRWAIVTPDMHRTHHSVDLREGNSNFGQIFSFWDRLFGTYVARPSVPEAELVMGLPQGARPDGFRVLSLLAFPFTRWPRRRGQAISR